MKDLDDAVIWVKKNQLSKRNLTDNERAILVGEIYNGRKKGRGAPEGNENAKQIPQVEGIVLDTAETVAQEVGVSRATVERNGKFAQQIEVLREDAA